MRNTIERISRHLPTIFRLPTLALALLVCGSAWADPPTATVVWESDFDTASKTGTDGNTYSLTLNGNTVNANGDIVIASSATTGAVVDTTAANSTAMTVLIKYAAAPAQSASKIPLSIFCDRSSGSKPDVGMVSYAPNNSRCYACWCVSSSSKEYNSTDGSDPVVNSSGGYLMVSFQSSTLRVYAGSSMAALAGGAKAYAWAGSKFTYVGLGGQTGKTTGIAYNAWDGMVIEKVAIFTSNAYTNSDLAEYKFPGEADMAAKKSSYWSNNSVYAWRQPTTASSANFNGATLASIDANGNTATATTTANWTYWCKGQSHHTTPEPVLVLDKPGYYQKPNGDFGDLSLGGLYVKSEQATDTYYGFEYTSGNRHTHLGDTSGENESWFIFNKSYAINRSGNTTFYGTVNVVVESGAVFDCNSSQTSKTMSFDSTCSTKALKVHGAGTLKVATLTATGVTLDYSDLGTQPTTAFINGTVAIDATTEFVLPAGAVSPYKIATAITGTYPSSITIGDKTYATTVTAGDNAGEIAWSINSATIDSDTTYTLEGLFGSTSTAGSYEIDVEESATLNVASATTIGNLTLNITDGKTLAITGADLTVSGEIIVNGGTASVASASALSGTVGGDGRFVYTTIPTGLTWTDSDWTGTLTLKDLTFEDKLFSTYGNTGSTLELVGVQGYNNEKVGGSQTWVNPTVKFTDSETAGREFGFKYTSANDGSYFTFYKIAGAGKLVCVDSSTQTMRASIFTDFSGSIDVGTHAFIFGTSANTGSSGTITVVSGASVTVASGETWTASNGLVVNGALTIADGATATGALSGSGSVVANKVFPSTTSGFTGTLTVNAAAFASGGTTTAATDIYGSVLNVADGVVILTGNVATLPTTVNIASGATLYFYNSPVTSVAMAIGTWEGVLGFQNCASLTTLSIDVGSKRSFNTDTDLTITLCSNLTTVNLTFDEVKGEGGAITLTDTTALPNTRTYNVTVNCLDGRTVTGTYDSSTSTISYVPSISGAATDIDWDFTDGVDDDFEQAPTGMYKYRDSALTFYTDAEDSTYTGVYIKHHPYTENNEAGASWFSNNSAAMSVVLVGTMPATSNTIFLNLGSAYANKYGLLIATTSNENEVLVAYNYGGTVTPITRMSVPNASTARHSYIITKVDGATATTFTIYLDGTKWKTVTTDAATLGTASDVLVSFTGTSGNGIQVGADYGSNIRNSGAYVGATDDVGVLNVLRAYGRVITQAEIDQYAATFPYTSPSGKSTRTFSATSEYWVDSTAESTVWTNTKSGEQSGTPDAGAQLEVTASAASAQTISVNLASQTSYESLLVEGTQTVTFELADGYTGAIAPGKTTIKTPVVVKPGVLNLSGGPTFIEGDGHLTFDYSDYTVTGTSAIELTGDVDRNDAAVTITPPTDQHYTYTYGYSGTQYVITPAVAVAVLNHNDTLTGYTTADAALAAAVSGDTVTLQTAYLTPSTEVATYTGDKTGVNVIVHGVTISPVVEEGTTTWTTDGYYHWTGEGADTNWTTPANWGLTSGCPNSNSSNVVFDADATVSLSASAFVGAIDIASGKTVVLSCAATNYILEVAGDIGDSSSTNGCTLVLNGAKLYAYAATVNIYATLVVSNDTENTLGAYAGKWSSAWHSAKMNIGGDVEGGGTLILTAPSGSSQSGDVGEVYVYGSMANFTGEGYFIQGTSLDVIGLTTSSVDNSGASWHAYESGQYPRNDAGKGKYKFFRVGDNTVYKFGTLNGRIYTCSSDDSGTVFQIGYRNEDCGVYGTLTSRKPTIDWVASVATFTYALTNNSPIIVSGGGTVVLATEATYPSALAFTNNSGVVKFADGLTGVDISSYIANSTAAIVFDDNGVDYTWATAIASSNTGGFTKKGSGTLTLSAVPAYSGATTVEAGTLVLPVGTALGALTIADDAQVIVSGTGDGTITWTGSEDDTTKNRITTYSGQSISCEYDNGTWTGTFTRTPLTYTWTGASDTNWETLGNWKIEVDEETKAAEILPQECDTVVFPASEGGWTVALSSAQTVTNVTANGAVSLSGAMIYTEKVDGDAVVTLAGNTGFHGYNYVGAKVTITTPINITGSSNQIAMYGKKSGTGYGGGTCNFSGAVTGDGEILLSGIRSSLNMTGDWTEFEGHVTVVGDGLQRNATIFTTISPTAYYCVTNSDQSTFIKNCSGTYSIGELTGTPSLYAYNYTMTFEVGGNDTDFACGGNYYYSANSYGRDLGLFKNGLTLKKVGSGKMTFSGARVHAYDVNEGELEFDSTNSLQRLAGQFSSTTNEDFKAAISFTGGTVSLGSNVPATFDISSQILNSTAAIKYSVDADTTNTWATALNANNTVHEIVKTGAGTLTLSAAPLWDGTTTITVEEGSVVVPIDTDITLAGDTYVETSDATTKTLSKHEAYSAAVDESTADVPYSWVKSNVDGFDGMTEEQIVTALAASSATTQANGYNYFTCYALGLDPTDEDDKPNVSVSVDSSGNLVFKLVHPDGKEIESPDTVAVTAIYKKYSSPSGTVGTVLSGSVTPDDIVGDGRVGYIRATITISASTP